MKKRQFRLRSLTMSAAGLTVLSLCPSAYAISTLKQVQVSNGSEIDLLFDTKISKTQIKTEFFNDVIQISLNDVSVYPAKISSVSGGAVTKIFAYQYAPKLVRCRLSVKGKAESYKDKIQILTNEAKMLTIHLDGDAVPVVKAKSEASMPVSTALNDKINLDSPRAKPADGAADAKENGVARADNGNAPKIDDIDERALLDRVMKTAPTAQEDSHKADLKNEAKSKSKEALGVPDPAPLAGGKPLPSPVNALEKLALVVGLFSLCALFAKKFWKNRAENNTQGAGLMDSLGKFAKKVAPQLSLGGRSRKMIEVISSHHLGPKKSIAVVRVAGNMLVLGITDEAINLITRISPPSSDSLEADDVGEQDDFDATSDLNAVLAQHVANSAQPKNAAPAPKQPQRGQPATSAGAFSAGPAIFSDILQSETSKPALGNPIVNAKVGGNLSRTAPKRDVRVTQYGAGGVQAPQAQSSQPKSQVNAQAAQGLSGVRAQIRNKLEGLKQI